MHITIRPVQLLAEYRAVEQVQREAWGMDDRSIVPLNMLITAHRHGGLVLGAFSNLAENHGTGLLGFVFSFLGRTRSGEIKHCSHMAGVLPAYQNLAIGYQLKCHQRDYLQAQGFQLITWTFDPLLPRNAYFNFRKLGVTCNSYLRNIYGTTFDSGVPTDRFEVEWRIASPRVVHHLDGTYRATSLQAMQERGIPRLNPMEPHPLSELSHQLDAERLLIEIPADIQTMKQTNLDLVQQWRYRTREFFETAFACGYTVTDLLTDQGQVWYVLER